MLNPLVEPQATVVVIPDFVYKKAFGQQDGYANYLS